MTEKEREAWQDVLGFFRHYGWRTSGITALLDEPQQVTPVWQPKDNSPIEKQHPFAPSGTNRTCKICGRSELDQIHDVPAPLFTQVGPTVDDDLRVLREFLGAHRAGVPPSNWLPSFDVLDRIASRLEGIQRAEVLIQRALAALRKQ